MQNKDFIGRYYMSSDLCDRLVEDYESKISIEEKAHSARGYSFIHSNDMDVDLLTEYEYEVYNALKKYQNEYSFAKEGINPHQIDFPFNFQKYYPGNYYSVWHCENNGIKKNKERHLAFMTYLNTVNDGGETEFLYQEIKVKPEKGLTLIWPAYFTHTHRGNPSATEVKYISTGWFTFFDTDSFFDSVLETSDKDFYEKIDQLNTKIS